MILSNDDINLIVGRLRARYSEEQINEWLDKPMGAGLRKKLAEDDFEFFCRFYLWEHFTRPPASIHRIVFGELEKLMSTPGRANVVFILPRGFAKTTIATLALPLWCICFKKRRHIPIISDSFMQAKDQFENLKREIEVNDRIIEDFGSLRGPVWQSADMETSNGVRVRALGQGMKLRGRKYQAQRPDLIILDDVEELEGVQHQAQRDMLYNWFMRTVMKAGWEDTKVVILGNFLHSDCLLARLSTNPMFTTHIYSALKSWPENMNLWAEWQRIVTNVGDREKDIHARQFFEEHKEEMLAGAESAWPEAFPVYDLMLMRVTGGDASFQTELQNDISDPERRIFKRWSLFRREVRAGEEWLIPLDGKPAVRLSDCVIFAATDPSLGRTAQADPSAISILAVAPNKFLFLLESDERKRSLDQLMNDQLQYARRYPIARWGIESNQFQAMFATKTSEMAREDEVRLPVVAVNQIGNKTMRIQSLQPDIENGIILLPEIGADRLKYELSHWPLCGNDDALDSLEIVRGLAGGWLPHQVSEIVQGDVYDFGSGRVEQPAYPWLDIDAEEGLPENAVFIPITVWR